MIGISSWKSARPSEPLPSESLPSLHDALSSRATPAGRPSPCATPARVAEPVAKNLRRLSYFSKGPSSVGSTSSKTKIVELAPIALIVISDHGTIRLFNPAASQLLGYASEEVVHENVSKLMPKRYAENHDSFLQRYLTTLQSHGVLGTHRTVEALHKDGYEIPVELHVADMCPDRIAFNEGRTNKKTHGFVAFMRDLRGSLARDRAQQEMDALLSQSPAPFLAIDLEGHITRFNAAAESSFGYKVDEVLGENVSLLMSSEHAGNHDDYLRRYLLTRERHVIGSSRKTFGRHKKGFLFPHLPQGRRNP